MTTGDHATAGNRTIQRTLVWASIYLVLCLVVGALAGIGWWCAVDLPTYTVGDNFTATTTERDLTEVFAADAWFSGIGFTAGIALGIVAWLLFGCRGPVVNLIDSLGGLICAVICWATGTALGPGDFNDRLASAQPGDVLPIELQLHSWVCLLVWVLAAVGPILVRVSIGPDPDDQAEPRRQPTPTPEASLTSGEVVGHDIAPIPLEPTPRPRRLLGIRLPSRRG